MSIRELERPGIGPIDLEVAAGECVALSGPSGAGKSLLLRALADLDPNTGEVAFDGVRRDTLPAPEWRKRIMYLAAEAGWWTERVGDHYSDQDGVLPILDRLRLPAAALEWSVERLSTGEKQRLALARLLELAPPVMLLDEPTAALDPKSRDAAEALIRERCESGSMALVVTHDTAQAERLGARRLILDNGRLRESRS